LYIVFKVILDPLLIMIIFVSAFPSGFLQGPFIGMGLKSIDYGALGSVVCGKCFY